MCPFCNQNGLFSSKCTHKAHRIHCELLICPFNNAAPLSTMAINPIETTDAISHKRYFPLNIGTIAECIQKRMVKTTKKQNQQLMLDSCIFKPQSSRHTTTRLHKSKINDVTHTVFVYARSVWQTVFI